jgi:nucleotide-binding universal stress UspA family protein
MFRKILIPLDGSPLAEKALAHIRHLAPPGSAELVLVNVIETYRYGFAATDIGAFDIMNYVRESAENYLQQQQRQLKSENYTVQAYVIDGDAAQGVLEVAETAKPDLIVMTTHGRSGVARWTLGSVAERIVHYAEQPVLLVRNTTRVIPLREMRRILVPLDGTDLGELALAPAQMLAQKASAELLLLRIVPKLDSANQEMLFEDTSAAQAALDQWQSSAQQYLADVAERVGAAGITHRTLIRRGERAHVILDVAHAENIDFLVMTTHGRIGFDRLRHGSVAAEVSRHLSCPVLLVRAHDPAE